MPLNHYSTKQRSSAHFLSLGLRLCGPGELPTWSSACPRGWHTPTHNHTQNYIRHVSSFPPVLGSLQLWLHCAAPSWATKNNSLTSGNMRSTNSQLIFKMHLFMCTSVCLCVCVCTGMCVSTCFCVNSRQKGSKCSPTLHPFP